MRNNSKKSDTPRCTCNPASPYVSKNCKAKIHREIRRAERDVNIAVLQGKDKTAPEARLNSLQQKLKMQQRLTPSMLEVYRFPDQEKNSIQTLQAVRDALKFGRENAVLFEDLRRALQMQRVVLEDALQYLRSYGEVENIARDPEGRFYRAVSQRVFTQVSEDPRLESMPLFAAVDCEGRLLAVCGDREELLTAWPDAVAVLQFKQGTTQGYTTKNIRQPKVGDSLRIVKELPEMCSVYAVCNGTVTAVLDTQHGKQYWDFHRNDLRWNAQTQVWEGNFSDAAEVN